MTEVVQNTMNEIELIECYLCDMEVPKDKAMSVPLTTGNKVLVHASCMEFYMQKTAIGPGTGACGGCSGGAGCC